MQFETYLNEFRMLKSEQIQRIGLRDNIVYVGLVASATVFAFVFSGRVDPLSLLALPLATFVLGWIHTNNDAKSSSIGGYIRCTLRKRVAELTGGDPRSVFGWEIEVRSGKQRPWRKLTDSISNIIAFVLPGALALAIYWLRYHQGALAGIPLTATIFEIVLLLVLLVWIFMKSDICWRGFEDTERSGAGRSWFHFISVGRWITTFSLARSSR